MILSIREKLFAAADADYASFNRSLIPGDSVPMIGVRMPKLRQIAKEIARTDGDAYICELKKEEAKNTVFHEELLLHGMVIGYEKCSAEKRKKLLDDFVPQISSWAVCDSCCTTFQFMRKEPDIWFSYLEKYLFRDREFEVRFAVVSMLAHFVNEAYIDPVLHALESVRQEGYYVKMAAAWAISVCYVKFPQKTEPLFTENRLDDFTHNKAIQKLRESLRITPEEKEHLNHLKRKKEINSRFFSG